MSTRRPNNRAVISDDYAKNVTNGTENGEELEWTTLCETLKDEKGMQHSGVTVGGNNMQKT